ncbi:retrotransposon protein, putative, unclassified [Tanacetum coccineum]
MIVMMMKTMMKALQLDQTKRVVNKEKKSDSAASGQLIPPPKDDDQSSKKPRESGASATKQHPALSSTGWQITDTRDAGADYSMHRSDPESGHSEQSSDDIPMKDEGNDSDMRTLTTLTFPRCRPLQPENNWANTYATTYKVPEENKLQRKTYDIGSRSQMRIRSVIMSRKGLTICPSNKTIVTQQLHMWIKKPGDPNRVGRLYSAGLKVINQRSTLNVLDWDLPTITSKKTNTIVPKPRQLVMVKAKDFHQTSTIRLESRSGQRVTRAKKQKDFITSYREKTKDQKDSIEFIESLPHKGVKASANSDVMYSFTSAQDGNPLQDDVRLCLGDDLKKLQDHSQRQASNTPNVSAASTSTCANADESSFVYLGGKIPIDASTLPNADLPIDPNMPDLEDASDTLPNDGIFNGAYDDDEDVGAVADFNNMDNTIAVSPIPTLRIHKDHPKGQILGDPTSAVQTRGKIQKASSAQQALVSYIHKQNRTNHKDHQNCLFACFLSQEEPKTISQALQDESWVEAMQEELLQFKLQKVWVLVDLPYGKKVIGTKWVFRNKRDERSIVVKNKARLVAQGFRQEEGIDYDEVFAHVARIEAIRLFLAFASYMGFTVYQMDVKNAFLYGTIKEEVYVHQPPSFVDPAHPNKVYKVIKALYGLHQAPGAWFETLSSFLMENGFRRADVLKKFDFLSIRTAATPIESNKPLVKDEDGVDVDVHVYRSMIGSLMYLTVSRQDIMFVVCACARFQVTPKVSHLNAVKMIFRYLKHQPKLGLWYPRDSPFELEAYSDSDYGGASLDRKSTTVGCQFLRRRLISWQCKKQTIVANSTTEAEYVAAANCCGQVLWIQNQMMDYGFNFMNTKIHIDNESTISVIKNPVAHSRTKHIEIRFHFIRDCYEKRLIEVIKIHTDHNAADLLTKGFDVTRISMDLRMDRSCAANSSYTWSKPNESVGFTEVVDFLKGTSLRSKEVYYYEAIVRSKLQLADATGIHNLSDAEIYAGLATLGVTSLEKELKETKQTLGNVVLKLVKKVKSLEIALKRKSKKVIVSASEGEEPEDQGRVKGRTELSGVNNWKRKAELSSRSCTDLTDEDCDTIREKLESNTEKKFYAEQKAKAKRSKPMTQAQQREYMSTFIKNQSSWKLSQLKKLSFEELKTEFEKLMKSIESFVLGTEARSEKDIDFQLE